MSEARLRWVGIVTLGAITLAFGAVLARVTQLQLAPSERLEAFINDRTIQTSQDAPRGDILDRRGRILSATRMGRRVFIDPARFPSPPDEAIVELAGAIDLSPGEVGERIVPALARSERRLGEGRSPLRYLSVGDVLADSSVDAVRSLDIPGVHLEWRSVRGDIASEYTASLLGKVGIDHDGLLGAEYAFDDDLAPTDGTLRYIHDDKGRALWLQVGSYSAPHKGENIRLSVDLALQTIVQEELWRGMVEADAAGGRAMLADPSTGEILAMADLLREIPDAQDWDISKRDLIDQGVRFEVIREDPNRDIHPSLARNRNVEDAYEPGSTFKPFMWSAVTELGLAEPDEVIDTHGGVWRTPYGRRIEDVHRADELSWHDVLVHSSNVGMVQVTDRMRTEQFRRAISKFGFGRPTRIGLPGEASGLVTDEENWTDYTRTSVAFGYEIAVTPVQMLRAFSIFARSGQLAGTLPNLKLTAIERDGINDEATYRVIPQWVARLAREAMRGVVRNMDTRLQQVGILQSAPRYSMFGKSGTSEVALTQGAGYFNQHTSSFVAAAPVSLPRLAIIVVIDDPGPERISRRQHYGSWVAGPVARRVMERALPYLGVKPDLVEGDESVPMQTIGEDPMALAD
ncbi:MAG: peptidoglycan D,D-transpeptidase FtsI family protein [Planctomycetota bacterium]|jgi:cell division protein FtsI (penicillin-binding protein 3)